MSTTVRVDAPADEVYDIVADPRRGPEWQTLVSELGEISGRPGGVGSSYVGYYRVAGRRLEGRFIVTAAERPTLHQAAGTTRGGWARWTTMIEPDGAASCDVRVSLEYELPGEVVGSLFGMLTGNRLEAEFRRTYLNLKRLAEAASAGDAAAPEDVEGHRSGLRRRPPSAPSDPTGRISA
ncbi:MAG TPA: SRPBCC family protein [Candidatus Limnocylindrales bacterium]|nr:SRPBCC family protein [Candidatus Limnocylindrales bacterium]